MTLRWRVRLLGRTLVAATGPMAAMSPAKRQALRNQAAPRRLREFVNGKAAQGVTHADALVPTPDGDLAVRIYRPATVTSGPSLPVVVAFHGGGWVFGDLSTAEWLFSEVAARGQALVVAVDYRLAPEHPAPAAHRDAFGATAWAAEHAAELGGRADRLAVLGESSGATLAAAVALAARDSGGPRIACQALLYPITDLTLSSPSVAELPDEPILRSSDLRAYVNLYLGRDGDPADPYRSPLLAPDHRGLPPHLTSPPTTTRSATTAGATPSAWPGAASRFSTSSTRTARTASSASPTSATPPRRHAGPGRADGRSPSRTVAPGGRPQPFRTSSGPPRRAWTRTYA